MKAHSESIAQSVALSPEDLKEATALLKTNKPQEALAELSILLKKNPSYYPAHYLRAVAYQLLNDKQQALADLNATIQARPNHLAALQLKTRILTELSQFQEALKTADKMIALFPDNPTGFLLRSPIYDRLDNVKKALDDANEAVRLAPENADAYSNRGYSYLNLGLAEDAIKDFSKAIQLDPTLIGAMAGRMFAYFMQSDYIACDKQCMDILGKVGMNDRCAPYTVIMAAVCRKQLKQLPERIALLNQASQTLTNKGWPYPIIQYMNEQVIAQAVLDQATDNDKMTEAKTYIAFDLLADNKGAEASPMIVWVKEHGNKAFNEYDLVSALLVKLKK